MEKQRLTEEAERAASLAAQKAAEAEADEARREAAERKVAEDKEAVAAAMAAEEKRLKDEAEAAALAAAEKKRVEEESSPSMQHAPSGVGAHTAAPPHQPARRPDSVGKRNVGRSRSPRHRAATPADSVAQVHSKMALSGLLRTAQFGDVNLFDRILEEHIGGMDDNPMRGMYAEHCVAEGSLKVFSPPNNPSLQCTPAGELAFVVGEDGIDTDTWKLKADTSPTCGVGSMVEGRNATPLSVLFTAEQALRAGLRPEEIVALRLYTGPMYSQYNDILRKIFETNSNTALNRYATTILLIISGILKLCRIASAEPGDEGVAVAYRGLSDLALLQSFFELDEQGFAGGVELAFMSVTDDKKVALQYSGAAEGKTATIFKLLLGKTSLGADVSWVSQFQGEQERLFPPWTHLQLVGEPILEVGGVSVITLKPTVFQNVRTLEEVECARKESIRELISSCISDLRNTAARDTGLDNELRSQFEALEGLLFDAHCQQDHTWYHDNNKYKGAFEAVLKEIESAKTDMRNPSSAIRKRLDVRTISAASAGVDTLGSGVSTNLQDKSGNAGVCDTNEVSALHSKFLQDPDFRGFRGVFGSDELFAAGIEQVVGRMDVQNVAAMYNEHNQVHDAQDEFTAWNAGHKIQTTPTHEWNFVVGSKGVDRSGTTWVFDLARATPEFTQKDMVRGRNVTALAKLMTKAMVKKAKLTVAEVVAVRLYSGPMYIPYNRAMRGQAKAGATLYPTTIGLIISALRKLTRATQPPPDLLSTAAMPAWPWGLTFSRKMSKGMRAEPSLLSCPRRPTATWPRGMRVWTRIRTCQLCLSLK